MTKRLQTYEAPDITVTFDPNVCTHAAACVRGLPAVFDIREPIAQQRDRREAAAHLDEPDHKRDDGDHHHLHRLSEDAMNGLGDARMRADQMHHQRARGEEHANRPQRGTERETESQ